MSKYALIGRQRWGQNRDERGKRQTERHNQTTKQTGAFFFFFNFFVVELRDFES